MNHEKMGVAYFHKYRPLFLFHPDFEKLSEFERLITAES